MIPTCRKCGDELDAAFVAKIQERRAALGMAASVPKLCILCFADIVMNMPDDDELATEPAAEPNYHGRPHLDPGKLLAATPIVEPAAESHGARWHRGLTEEPARKAVCGACDGCGFIRGSTCSWCRGSGAPR